MAIIDLLLSLLLPSLILLHLLVAPYTKVEESFNIQATHDLISYSLTDLSKFDHTEFPGAVPRTFIGSVILAALSKPILIITNPEYAQFIVRGMLGLLNAAALLRYRSKLAIAYGKNVGRWYILLQATQFHVIYYASRLLPNMFAFVLTTLALAQFLPTPGSTYSQAQKQYKIGIFLFVGAGIIFRAEIALLLFTQLVTLLLQKRISLRTIIAAGLVSPLVALGISIPIDSYFWQQPTWPELAGLYFNVILGKAAEWGTSPYSSYFVSLLPRLLLNPFILTQFIPLSLAITATQAAAGGLVFPAAVFIAIYSFQPHKEARFIIYIVPSLTAAASLSVSYVWVRRAKAQMYSIGSIFVILTVLGSFAASTIMLFVSSLNYPGGEAITALRGIVLHTNHTDEVYVHMDVLSCMTGVTHFQELSPEADGIKINIKYDKEEKEEVLLQPEFWEQFDYALMEEPGKAIGGWEVVGTVYGYAGMEFLKPGMSAYEGLEVVYAANNATTEDGKTLGKEDVAQAAADGNEEPRRPGSGLRSLGDIPARLGKLYELEVPKEISRIGLYRLVKDAVRLITGGYWIGPRMAPAIRILKKLVV